MKYEGIKNMRSKLISPFGEDVLQPNNRFNPRHFESFNDEFVGEYSPTWDRGLENPRFDYEKSRYPNRTRSRNTWNDRFEDDLSRFPYFRHRLENLNKRNGIFKNDDYMMRYSYLREREELERNRRRLRARRKLVAPDFLDDDYPDILKNKAKTKLMKRKILNEVKRVLELLDFENIVSKTDSLKLKLEIDFNKQKNGELKTKVFFQNLDRLKYQNPSEKHLESKINTEKKYKKIQMRDDETKKTDWRELSHMPNNKKFEKLKKKFSLRGDGEIYKEGFGRPFEVQKTIKLKNNLNQEFSDMKKFGSDKLERNSNNKEASNEDLSPKEEQMSESESSFQDSYEDVSLNDIRMRRTKRKEKARNLEKSQPVN